MLLKKYEDKQKLFYKFITRSFNNKKISHAYLIETNGVNYADDLVKEFVKFLLCNNKDKCNQNCNICHLVDSDSYPDLKIIDNGIKTIKKEQVMEIQSLFSTKPIYGNYMIYIIKNVENFTNASANTLLKFLEEPSPSVIAILMTNSSSLVIDTIVSRCQVISLVKEENILKDYYSKYSSLFEDENKFNERLNDYYNFYLKLEVEKNNMILENNIYNFKDELQSLFEFGLLFYSSLFDSKDVNFSSFDKKTFKDNNNLDKLLKKVDLLNDFYLYAKINCNKDLLIDSFIIKMCEVN